MDLVFGGLLLVLFLASIILFITKGFFSDSSASSQLSNSLLSGTGVSGSAIFYMRWNITRRSRLKEASPEELGNVIEGKQSKEIKALKNQEELSGQKPSD